MLLICLPFWQDSDVIMTSAPNFRQQSAIFSSSVATTRTKENYQLELKEAKPDIHMPIKQILKCETVYFVVEKTVES